MSGTYLCSNGTTTRQRGQDHGVAAVQHPAHEGGRASVAGRPSTVHGSVRGGRRTGRGGQAGGPQPARSQGDGAVSADGDLTPEVTFIFPEEFFHEERAAEEGNVPEYAYAFLGNAKARWQEIPKRLRATWRKTCRVVANAALKALQDKQEGQFAAQLGCCWSCRPGSWHSRGAVGRTGAMQGSWQPRRRGWKGFVGGSTSVPTPETPSSQADGHAEKPAWRPRQRQNEHAAWWKRASLVRQCRR